MTREITPAEIREGVRATFSRVAETPRASFRFPVGATLARDIGYPEDVLTSVPTSATECFTGLAYLHPHLGLQPGEHVLDLGPGGGLDSVLAARAVAPNGSVKGLDLSAAMVARARALAATLGLKNAEFIEGNAEAMPFPDGAFDAALVNGFFNLCPDKAAVAAELSRVLKPGGRAAGAEITFTDPLPPTEVRTIDDWFR
jgi:SAM-dependent methyltransferase